MLSGRKLPSLVIVAMGNPQGRCDLLPQTKQRFWWVDVTWDAKTWVDYMKRTWHFTPHSTLTQLISEQYKAGFKDTAKFNYLTPRTIENLFRIALTIESSDPFWVVSGVDYILVDALYNSMKDVDTFRTTLDQLHAWVDSRETVDPWADLVSIGLTSCSTMSELRTFISSLEAEELAPDFLEFLKTQGETSDESYYAAATLHE